MIWHNFYCERSIKKPPHLILRSETAKPRNSTLLETAKLDSPLDNRTCLCLFLGEEIVRESDRRLLAVRVLKNGSNHYKGSLLSSWESVYAYSSLFEVRSLVSGICLCFNTRLFG